MNPLDIHPSALYGRVQSDIGSFQVLENYRQNSARTGVWKLQAEQDSKCYYIKTYSRKQRWHPEVYAYRHWVGHLKSYVPDLMAAYEGRLAGYTNYCNRWVHYERDGTKPECC